MPTLEPAVSEAPPSPNGGNGGAKKRGGGERKEKPPQQERPPFDAAAFVRNHNLWWYAHKNNYWMPGPDGTWLGLTKEDLRMWLQAEGLMAGTQNMPVMEVERVIMWTQGNRKLAAVMTLAGHFAGVETIRGVRVLISEGPELIAAVKDRWPLLRRMCANLFCRPLDSPDQPPAWKIYVNKGVRNRRLEAAIWKGMVKECGDGEDDVDEELGEGSKWVYDQRDVFFFWCKLYLELMERRARGHLHSIRNGQALVLAGPSNGGKSLLIDFVLAPLFGGRMSNASKYLKGTTQFNSSLFGSELLVMSDTPLSTKWEDRLVLGDGIREVVANQFHAWEGKGKDQIDALNPLWRLIISMNDDAANIRTLPPFSLEGVGDKIHLVHTCTRQMPMPTTTLEEYEAFGAALRAELAAFKHFLLHEYEPPAWLLGGRFGMLTIQAPDLMAEMFDDSPQGEMIELMDSGKWTPSAAAATDEMGLWDYVRWQMGKGESPGGVLRTWKDREGTEHISAWWAGHLDLKHLLTHENCSVRVEAEALFRRNHVKTLLKRLSIEMPNRVQYYRQNKKRGWLLAPLPEEE